MAGTWYPGDAAALAAAVDGHLANADRDVEGSAAQQPIRVRGNRAGVDQPGMRTDERRDRTRHVAPVAIGIRQVAIDGGAKRRRSAWIPAARDRRSPNSTHC